MALLVVRRRGRYPHQAGVRAERGLPALGRLPRQAEHDLHPRSGRARRMVRRQVEAEALQRDLRAAESAQEPATIRQTSPQRLRRRSTQRRWTVYIRRANKHASYREPIERQH